MNKSSMPGRTYEFVQLDVFTQAPLEGNPLAIFTDAQGLSDGEMQALAREMNLSETTFILQRDAATEAREGKKVRIFTVEQELPFAGHPTLGTALYLYASESNSKRPAELTLDLKAGKIPVHFTWNSVNAAANRVDGQVFGEMRQHDPEFGITLPREQVARIIGVAADEIHSDWPVQPVSTGLTFTIVPFRNQQTLSKLKFNYTQAAEFLKNTCAAFFYFLCPERRERAGSKLELECSFMAAKILRQDRPPAALPVGWFNTESQRAMSTYSFDRVSNAIGQARCMSGQRGKVRASRMFAWVATRSKYCGEPWSCE